MTENTTLLTFAPNSTLKLRRRIVIEKVKALLSNKEKEAVINEYKALIDELAQIDDREKSNDQRI